MSTLCMSQCDPPFEKSWLRPCIMSFRPAFPEILVGWIAPNRPYTIVLPLGGKKTVRISRVEKGRVINLPRSARCRSCAKTGAY